MAGEEVADHIVRRLSFRVPCISGGVWTSMRVVRKGEDRKRRQRRVERHRAAKFGLHPAHHDAAGAGAGDEDEEEAAAV